MADINLGIIENIRGELPKLKQKVAGPPTTEAIPLAPNVLTNTELLIQTLEQFYSRTAQASFLPQVITSHIFEVLGEISAFLSTPQPGADDTNLASWQANLQTTLKKMDDLYAFCLQYGLITFGFDPKVAQEQVATMRASVVEIDEVKQETERRIAEGLHNLNETIAASLVSVSDRAKEYEESLKKKLEPIDTQLAQIAAHSNEIATAASTAKAEIETIQKVAGDAAKTQRELSDLSASTTTKAAEIVQGAKDALGNSQNSDKQSSELAASAKASLTAVTQAKADIEVQLKTITEFYGEIQLHKQKMLDVQNEATAAAAALKRSTDSNLADYSARTQTVIQNNEELIGEIKDHLRRAIGASYFSAFDNRRSRLFRGVIFWAVMLLAGLGAAAFLAFEFSVSISSGNLQLNVILARILIAAPVAFWIGFCARQYSRERRAQEEYAFKATISISLEPYRELIDKMRKDGKADDIDFLKERIKDIFDNPTKRLYPLDMNSESTDPNL